MQGRWAKAPAGAGDSVQSVGRCRGGRSRHQRVQGKWSKAWAGEAGQGVGGCRGGGPRRGKVRGRWAKAWAGAGEKSQGINACRHQRAREPTKGIRVHGSQKRHPSPRDLGEGGHYTGGPK